MTALAPVVRVEWTPDMDKLITMQRGLISAREMAKTMCVTHNAIIGRWHRLGLPPLQNPLKGGRKHGFRPKKKERNAKPSNKPKILSRREPVRPTTPAQDLAIPFAQRCSFEELTKQTCRWPVGEDAEMFFCGAHPLRNYPYCAGHCARAYERFTVEVVCASDPIGETHEETQEP